MTTTKHHKLGASTAHRWGNCPGSVALSQNAPKLPPSKYAAQGAAAHEWAAEAIIGRPAAVVTGERTVDGFTFILSYEDHENSVCLDHVRTYADYINNRVAEHGISKVLVEQKVNIPGTDLFGTADAILIDPYNFMEVIDFKYGKGVRVTAKDNKQLLYYAAASYLSLPEPVRAEIPKIIVTIVQPRAGGIESYSYTPAEIMEFMGWLMAAKLETEVASEQHGRTIPEFWSKTYLKPGDHCRWCPANPVCPALQTYTVDIISNGDAKLDFVNESNVTLPDPASLPLDVLARIFHKGDEVKDYIDKCYSLFNVYAKQGKFEPSEFGLKLVEGLKHRKWQDETQVQIELMNKGYELKDILTEPKTRSPNQIKTLLGKNGGKEFYETYSYKPAGEISLAPLADKRPAVKAAIAANDFGDEALENQLTKSIEAETIA